MRAQDGQFFPALADDSSDFTLAGGHYMLAIAGVTGTGTFTLSRKINGNYVDLTDMKVTGGTLAFVRNYVPGGTYRLTLGSTLTADTEIRASLPSTQMHTVALAIELGMTWLILRQFRGRI